jgi:hypothetical protein
MILFNAVSKKWIRQGMRSKAVFADAEISIEGVFDLLTETGFRFRVDISQCSVIRWILFDGLDGRQDKKSAHAILDFGTTTQLRECMVQLGDAAAKTNLAKSFTKMWEAVPIEAKRGWQKDH